MNRADKCTITALLIFLNFVMHAGQFSCHVQEINYDVATVKAQFITAEVGGRITVRNVSLEIPPKALTQDQLISLSVEPLDPETQHIANNLSLGIDTVIHVEAESREKFQPPLTLTVPLPPKMLPEISKQKKQAYAEITNFGLNGINAKRVLVYESRDFYF